MANHNMGLYDAMMGHMEDPARAHAAYQCKMSPMSTDSAASSSSPHNDSGLWAHSPNADTDCSDFSASSPPASDDGFAATYPMQHSVTATQDWDLLSEMLIDDALNTMHAGTAPQSFDGHVGYEAFNGAPHKSLYDQPLPFQPPQQHQQHQEFQQNQQFHQNQQVQQNQQGQQNQQLHQRQFTSGFMDALLMQDDAAMAMAMAVAPPSSAASKRTSAMGSPQTTDLFPGVTALSLPVLPSPLSSSGVDFSATSPSQSLTPPPQPRTTANKARKISSISTASSSSSTPVAVKNEPHASPDELKKLRRRSQIASSVQRHREKKKCLVATLKSDLSSLTSQLSTLRAQRKSLHATTAMVTTSSSSSSSRLAEWEEEAITQRRKRKQSEELNQQMKQALFQQTCFLQGLRSLMGATTSNSIASPTTREMQIHDYLHAYTVLSASRDPAVRHREYLACFPQGKVDMAHQIVLRETDPYAGRLTSSANPYFAEIRVLHDGTELVHDEQDVQLRKELREPREWAVPGSGAVVKKYTSMFLFEERGRCTLEAFQHVALEATKSVGVFWPSPGYSASALETIAVDDQTQLIYSDLHGSMALIDGECGGGEQEENRDDVQLEARMLCRVQHTADATVIAWDYADKDDRLPICGAGKRNNTSIRRDSCGAAVVQREPGGKISFRSVCVKMFRPMEEEEEEQNKDDEKENTQEEREEARAVAQRRINLQVSEKERQNQKCVRSVYESLAAAFSTK